MLSLTFLNKKIVIALAGNKIDLESHRAVDHEEAKVFAEQHGLIFMETSAKFAKNVQDIFLMIAKNLPIDNNNVKISDIKKLEFEETKKVSKCCS